MVRTISFVTKVAIAAAFVVISSASIVQAQCSNSVINDGGANAEVCDNGPGNDTQAVGCCAAGCQAFVTAGTTCRPDAGICDNGAETCDGSTAACPADGFADSTTVCRPSSSVCDAAENCTGNSGTCPADIVAEASVVCRTSLGVCDPAENCDGTTGACPADVKSTSVCRPDSGQCDNGAEQCDGTNNACPADSAAAQGILCRTSLGDCDPQEVCDGTNSTCPSDTRSSSLCRASAGECDEAEFCDGGVSCPANQLSTDSCREAAGPCDEEEFCDGTNLACPADEKLTTVCRPDSGVCDNGEEVCDGTNNACPADDPINQGTPCRSATGVCDIEEVCDGTNSACPADEFRNDTCRASAGDCDLEETCTGSTGNCPADAKSTQVCRPVVNPICDVEETCDGTNDNCPDDELLNCEDTDEEECTEATCDEVEGCILGDACIEICRGPGFWSTHSGWEKGENIGEAVLDEAGPLFVCGQTISNTTELGYLTASLEGFCMRTQGVKERQLYRFLLTTAFNCAISEGGSCDDITDDFMDVSYDECNALCAGEDVGEDGPTLQECKHELGCFNSGGRIIDGDCAKGTCEEDTETYCGADYGDCPLLGDQEQDCVPFEDSCARQPLCSEDNDAEATICPKPGPASSPKTCREARHNDCTIDDCPVDPNASCAGLCGPFQAPAGCWCDLDSCIAGDGCPDRDDVCPGVCDD
jgi:hypothetical protein